MIHERDTSTLLKKLGANTRLWIALACICAILCFQNLYLAIVIMLTSYAFIIEEKLTGLFKFLAIATFMMGLMQFSIYGMIVTEDLKGDVMTVLFNTIPYYTAGFRKAIHFFFRIAPLFSCLFLMFKTLEMTDLGTLMTKVGLPYRYAFIFIDCFMTISVLSKDMEQIMDAQKARGLVTEGNLITRMKAFVPVIVPVVANSIGKVQDQAIAMDTKGFNSKCNKTIYRTIPCNKADKIIKVIAWLVIALSLTYVILCATKVIPADIKAMISSTAYNAADFSNKVVK